MFSGTFKRQIIYFGTSVFDLNAKINAGDFAVGLENKIPIIIKTKPDYNHHYKQD